jgi:hypothetical protein
MGYCDDTGVGPGTKKLHSEQEFSYKSQIVGSSGLDEVSVHSLACCECVV